MVQGFPACREQIEQGRADGINRLGQRSFGEHDRYRTVSPLISFIHVLYSQPWLDSNVYINISPIQPSSCVRGSGLLLSSLFLLPPFFQRRLRLLSQHINRFPNVLFFRPNSADREPNTKRAGQISLSEQQRLSGRDASVKGAVEGVGLGLGGFKRRDGVGVGRGGFGGCSRGQVCLLSRY